MRNTEHGFPIMESDDLVDLNQYTEDVAKVLETELSRFGDPLTYQGQVSTVQDLPANATKGEIYSVLNENKNYVWTGAVWTEYASTIDFSQIEAEINDINDAKLEKTIAVTTAGTNLNDYITEGRYYFSSNVTPTNIPIGVNGWLEVLKGDKNVKQFWYRHGTVNTNDHNTYVRTKTSTGWSDWTEIMTSKGGTINGYLTFNNTDNYNAIRKTRIIGEDSYELAVGVAGNGGAQLSLDKNGINVGKINVGPDGKIYNDFSGERLVEKNEIAGLDNDGSNYGGLYKKSVRGNNTTFTMTTPNVRTDNFGRKAIIACELGLIYIFFTHGTSTVKIPWKSFSDTTVSVTLSESTLTITFGKTIYGGVSILFLD